MRLSCLPICQDYQCGRGQPGCAYIIGTGLTMIAIAFIMMGGGIGGAWFASKASISFGADLRNDCFKKVQKFSFANIDAFPPVPL